MKVCTRCGQKKEVSEYFVKDKKSGRLHSQCKECYKEHRKINYAQHYQKYAEEYKQRAIAYRLKIKTEYRENMLRYLYDKACVICGEDDIRTFEFDHIKPNEKLFNISQAVRLGYKWGDVLKEMQKCRILCANCHKKHTAVQAGWYKFIQ